MAGEPGIQGEEGPEGPKVCQRVPCFHSVVQTFALNQKHKILKHITCNSFPWNKAGHFRTPILCANMDINKMEAARAGKCFSYVTSE